MARANEDPLSLPQRADAPVTLRIGENKDAVHVFVGTLESYREDRVPMAGRIDLEGDTLTFTPAFGFVAGVSYVARVRVAGEDDRLVPFRIPPEAAR